MLSESFPTLTEEFWDISQTPEKPLHTETENQRQKKS